jgi:hypothetical protein
MTLCLPAPLPVLALPACPACLQELKIQYGPAKGKAYTEEEDRFLVSS